MSLTLSDKVKMILQKYTTAADPRLLAEMVDFVVEWRDEQQGIEVSLRTLEDYLVILRELMDKYNSLPEKTGSDMIRIDELRQMEFKITQLIFENKN